MDMRLWKQAQADNPDPVNYIPVPIIGFTEVCTFFYIRRGTCTDQRALSKGISYNLLDFNT